MVDAFLRLDHAVTHVEPMEEDTGYPEGKLRKVEQDAGLIDKVDALGSP